MGELRGPQPPARSNVYTVLALIALIALAVGIGFVIWKAQTLTGEGNPWEVVGNGQQASAWITESSPFV